MWDPRFKLLGETFKNCTSLATKFNTQGLWYYRTGINF